MMQHWNWPTYKSRFRISCETLSL
uniref:Uncharacterized protein n=1 Tax=Arundo donax TaxID=35708 RepID=A0A0A9HB86_ARUDO